MPKHAASRLWDDSPQVATLMYMLSAICGSCGVCVICVIVSVVKVFRKKLQRKRVHTKKYHLLEPNVVTSRLLKLPAHAVKYKYYAENCYICM